MKNDDCVSLEVAELLKENGYDVPCRGFYCKMYDITMYCGRDNIRFSSVTYDVLDSDDILIPTLYDAQKWLREKHDIKVLIVFDTEEYTNRPLGYSYDIYVGNRLKEFRMHFKTYEQALNEGIKEAIKFIKL